MDGFEYVHLRGMTRNVYKNFKLILRIFENGWRKLKNDGEVSGKFSNEKIKKIIYFGLPIYLIRKKKLEFLTYL